MSKQEPVDEHKRSSMMTRDEWMDWLEEAWVRQAIAEAENQYAAKAAALAHLSDRIQIDPKTGNVSIGSKCEAEVKWDASAPLVMTPHPAFQKREWVGLTDEEIDTAWRSVDYTVPYNQFRIDVARAIEAKLKEKNQ
jgi:hypothetical protein